MNEQLIRYFQSFEQFTPQELEAIDATMETRSYPRNTLLLREGQYSSAAYFVLEGVVRQYYLVDGEERCCNFYSEGQWVVSINFTGIDKASDHFLCCSTDVTLAVGNRLQEENLYRNFPKMETVSRKILERFMEANHQQMQAYLTESPEQRYLQLVETRPTLINRIPQYQIASYIGVKPESLSRIRKRMASKLKA